MKHFDRTVENAESEYAAWRDANPRSFVVNEKPGEWMLHFANCSHLQQFKAFDAKLVESPKTCMTSGDSKTGPPRRARLCRGAEVAGHRREAEHRRAADVAARHG
jgi:hypothetical protein